MPEINPKDVALFKSILGDLFPRSNVEEKDYGWLRDIFEQKCREHGYEAVDALYQKFVEAYEMSGYRQGVMLVGNPYTGKSFILTSLTDAFAMKNQLNNTDMDLGMFLCIAYKNSN